MAIIADGDICRVQFEELLGKEEEKHDTTRAVLLAVSKQLDIKYNTVKSWVQRGKINVKVKGKKLTLDAIAPNKQIKKVEFICDKPATGEEKIVLNEDTYVEFDLRKIDDKFILVIQEYRPTKTGGKVTTKNRLAMPVESFPKFQSFIKTFNSETLLKNYSNHTTEPEPPAADNPPETPTE